MQNMPGYKAMQSRMVLPPEALLMELMNPITNLVLVIVTTFMFTNMTGQTKSIYITVINAE
ncbi:hypothetical protein [Virgibacillus siamensis]|uniref:hypothetical protein n=1 Tax=Virgibacillus siamensis TaxID=480071 RepID=UPI0009872DB2|nr:hypothetical protein [Virgibacillus siamensis]